jgi:hypothetical protein
MTEGDASSHSFAPLGSAGRTSTLKLWESGSPGHSLEAQFQPVNDPSDPAVIEMVNKAMWAYEYAPASEPKLTSPSEVQQAIRGLKVGKAPCPNGIPNRVLRHLPKRAITFLTKVFNAVLRRQYFRQHGNTLSWCPYWSRERTPRYLLPMDS